MIKFNSSYLIIILIIIIYLCYLTNITILEETFTNNMVQLCKNGNIPHSIAARVNAIDVSNLSENYVDCIKKFSVAYQDYATYNPKEPNPCKFFNNINSDFSYTCNEFIDTSMNSQSINSQYSGLLFARNTPSSRSNINSSNYFDPLLNTANKIIKEFKSIDVSINGINTAMDDYIDGNYRAKLDAWKDCSDGDRNITWDPNRTSGFEGMSCQDISNEVFRIFDIIYKPQFGWDSVDRGYENIGTFIEDLSYMKSDFYDNTGNVEPGTVSDGYVRNYLYGSGIIKGKGQQWLGQPDTSYSNFFTRMDNSYSIIHNPDGEIFYKDISDSVNYTDFIYKINKTFGRNNTFNFKSIELQQILSSRMKVFTIIFTIIISLAVILSLYYYNIIDLSLIKIICIILFIIIVIFVIHFYGNLDSIKIIINNLLQ